MGNLKLLQEGLKKLWTSELYSKAFNASPVKHKDFDHALKHIFKAAARLLEMTEEADHDGSFFEIPAVEKYIADLLICTVRLANVAPNGLIDVETIVFERIRRKMGAEIDTEPDLKRQLRTAQEVINKHVADQMEGLHCVDCVAEEGDLCDCPMVVPIFEAMKGYENVVQSDLKDRKKKEPVMVKCPGSCGQMIRADWGHSCGSQEVHGMCPGCNKYVPTGFYRCNGDGSHPAVAQRR